LDFFAATSSSSIGAGDNGGVIGMSSSSSPRVFAKNCFPQFSPIHELGKLQWHPLNLTTLSAGDAEEGVYPGRRRRRSIMWRSTRT
jgi:hypothetical protein